MMPRVKTVFRGLLRRGRPRARVGSGMMHLPADIKNAEAVTVFSGPGGSDAWPAILIANTLQRSFGYRRLSVLCSERDEGLFRMISPVPDIHSYAGAPSVPPGFPEDDAFDGNRLLFYPYRRIGRHDESFLAEVRCGIRIAPLDDNSDLINLAVRTGAWSCPEYLLRMCSAVGVEFDIKWRPSIRDHVKKAAEHILAPVSGRMSPYIAVTSPALSILQKSRAEIPLKAVPLDVEGYPIGEIDRETRTAIVAGAAAVATDSDAIWSDACAFGVPATGLDRTDGFMKWDGRNPSADEDGFIGSWVDLLKRGLNP